MMKTLAAVMVFALGACSQRVYSPPSQAFGLGPVTSLAPGQRTLDVELANHSQVFDPGLRSGAARYTQNIDERTDAQFEGTVFNLEGGGNSTENRNVYAGRAGVRNSPGEDLALFAGAGGGYSPAGGSFATLDAGLSVGIHNCVLVPVMQASGFVSQPLDPHPIDVSDSSMTTTYDTPSRTVGGTIRGGLRLSLTPSACRKGEPGSWLYGGIDVTGVRDDDSADELIGIGLGLSVPL